MKINLTKKAIDAMPAPATGRAVLTDTQVRNLSVFAYPSGKRTWNLFYRTHDRRQRNAKLGTFPALSVEAARRLAGQYLADVSRGIDPMAVRKDKAGQKTVADLARWFREEHVERKLKPSTREEYERLLDKFILPALGKHRLDAVTPEMVRRLHHAMGGTPRQANHAMSVLHRMMNDAITLGWRKDPRNPVARLSRYKENKRKRYLDRAEFSRLWQVLMAELRVPRDHDAILALVLLLLTGRRKGEVLNLTWDEVDLVRGRMMLRDSKVGAREYQLSAQVVKLLREAHAARARDRLRLVEPGQGPGAGPVETNRFVIRGRGGKDRLVGLQKVWERIRTKAGLKDVRLHDLRHTYASMAIEAGADLAVVKDLLGHNDIATTQRYAHVYTDRLQKTVKAVEDGIMAAVEGAAA